MKELYNWVQPRNVAHTLWVNFLIKSGAFVHIVISSCVFLFVCVALMVIS